MAIGTYSELKTAIAGELNRADLTTKIAEFIELAEAGMRKDVRLRGASGITRSTLSVSSQFTSLPSGFRGFVSVNIDGDADKLVQFVDPYTLDEVRIAQPTGVPTHYTIIGTEMEVAPVPTEATTFEIAYHSSLTALSDSATTNWMLTDNPDIYLYGALIRAAHYLHEDERIGVWRDLYEGACNDFERAEIHKQYSAAPLKKRTRTIGGN
jgi:hypothetical protein